MALSLQDQLLNSGLIKKSKANQAKKEKYKQTKQQRNSNITSTQEATLHAQQSLAKKQAKDRELNQLQKQEADKKALYAQINQLIQLNIQEQDPEGVAFHFSDQNKIKTIYVNEVMQKNISAGKLAVVKYDADYALVPAAIAEKIRLRVPEFVLVFNDTPLEDKNVDDPYADYKIPDDLMW